jgi:hypothetical protein
MTDEEAISLYRNGSSIKDVAIAANRRYYETYVMIRESGFKRPARKKSSKPRAAQRYAPRTCESCNSDYVPAARQQRFCATCGVDTHLLKRHGITSADYQTLIEAQHGLCAICSLKLNKLPSNQVHIDHDHKTAYVRGIVCLQCNLRLAVLEARDWCEKAEAYLQAPGILVPRCRCRNTQTINQPTLRFGARR